MSKSLEKFIAFIEQHHVLTLATCDGETLSACSLFYAYSSENHCFVVASSDDTLHIQQINTNNNIAGNILLETKEVGKIQGLQFRGKFVENDSKELRNLYYKTFPYALAMQPKLWKIEIEYMKLTDNRLGFGKKLIWP